MKYKRACKSHIKSIASIEDSLYEDPWTYDQIEEMVDDENTKFISAISDKKIVGYIVLFNSNSGWIIESVSISPEYQRMGIGTNLLKMVPKLVNNQKVRVFVGETYLAMHLLLKKMGYIAISVEHSIGDHDFYQFVLDSKKDS